MISSPIVPDAAAEKMIRLSKQHLERKSGIPEAQIGLFLVSAAQWPDTSMGCPQPGQVYSQVITPGYQILLQAGGKMFVYHTDKTARVVLCAARPPDEIYLPP